MNAKIILAFVLGIAVTIITGDIIVSRTAHHASVEISSEVSSNPPVDKINVQTNDEPVVTVTPITTMTTTTTPVTVPVVSNKTDSRTLSQNDLIALAGKKYADGNVPLGDYKYVTDAPKKGYIYLCNVHKDNPGSAVNGPWITGDVWNFLKKIAISGSVSWPSAYFSDIISAGMRTLSGNGLPMTHNTGTFPVQASDAAAQYDKNPNSISAQTIKASLPGDPTYSETPYCMGGEVGIMLTGVPLFNGFDAGLRDAAAHELQDLCDGHPQGSGEYHYHSLSACFKDTSISTVLGYAYDGFPITGPMVTKDTYLTTDDLDICHGITSEITMDGKKKTTYHYVMTYDFPYSIGCFRGKPITTGPSAGQSQSTGQNGSNQTAPSGQGQPPQEAINACTGKSDGSSCSFVTPQGTMSGVCHTPPNSSLACVPNR